MSVKSVDKILVECEKKLLEGYSPERIKEDTGIDIEAIREVQENLAIIANKDASQSRAIIRQRARDLLALSTKFMEELITGAYDLELSNVSKVKFEAAKYLITYASKFVQEDALTMMVEQSSGFDTDEKPLVFEVKVDETGKTTHEVRTSDNH